MLVRDFCRHQICQTARGARSCGEHRGALGAATLGGLDADAGGADAGGVLWRGGEDDI